MVKTKTDPVRFELRGRECLGGNLARFVIVAERTSPKDEQTVGDDADDLVTASMLALDSVARTVKSAPDCAFVVSQLTWKEAGFSEDVRGGDLELSPRAHQVTGPAPIRAGYNL
jgi:hypothetical protein